MPRRHLQSFGRVIVHEKLCCADYRRSAFRYGGALFLYIAVRLKAPENAMKQYNRIADAIMAHLIHIIDGKRDIFLKKFLLRFL